MRFAVRLLQLLAIGMLFLQGWCDYVLPPIDSSPLPFEHCGLVGRWKGQGEGETVYQDFTENGTAVVWRAGYDGRYTIFHTSYLSKNGQKLLFRPMDNPSATGAEVLIKELNCDKSCWSTWKTEKSVATTWPSNGSRPTILSNLWRIRAYPDMPMSNGLKWITSNGCRSQSFRSVSEGRRLGERLGYRRRSRKNHRRNQSGSGRKIRNPAGAGVPLGV